MNCSTHIIIDFLVQGVLSNTHLEFSLHDGELDPFICTPQYGQIVLILPNYQNVLIISSNVWNGYKSPRTSRTGHFAGITMTSRTIFNPVRTFGTLVSTSF